MAKSKSISSEELIKNLEEYRLENPNVVIKIPEFGDYLRKKGYLSIQDYTIRRDAAFRGYLDKINTQSEDGISNELVTYRALDIDDFLNKNNSKEKLKLALSTRDTYYAKIATNAANSIKLKKKYEEENQKLKEKICELEKENQKCKEKVNNQKLKEKDEIIRKLKDILDSYIYPDAANAMLKQAGIFEPVNQIIPSELIEEKTIHADSDIKKSQFDTINKMLDVFED